MKIDTYQIITDRIIEQLEKGTIPWKKSWVGSGNCPKNFISKKPYNGINVFLLACVSHTSNYFLTYNQAKKIGGQVKKGEKGYPVVFWKFLDKKNNKGKTDKIPLCRYYTVFNLDQCDGIKDPDVDNLNKIEFNPIEQAEKIVAGYIGKPEIKHNEQRAYYAPKLDYVNMPLPESFTSEQEYYSVLFHELTHSTGHENRLNREGITESHFFGDALYSKEELIAELGSAFLCSESGINSESVFQNSSAYINGWLKKLKQDNKIIISSAGKAQKAVDKILNRKKEIDE